MFANKLYTHTKGHILFSHWIYAGSQQLFYLSFELKNSCVLNVNTFLLFFFSTFLSFQVICFFFLNVHSLLECSFIFDICCWYTWLFWLWYLFWNMLNIFFIWQFCVLLALAHLTFFICVLHWISVKFLLFNFLLIFLWTWIFLQFLFCLLTMSLHCFVCDLYLFFLVFVNKFFILPSSFSW